MLADHLLRALVGEPVVVVRDAGARRDDHIADAVVHLARDVAEQVRRDRLVAGEHPRSRALGRPPRVEHLVAAAPGSG